MSNTISSIQRHWTPISEIGLHECLAGHLSSLNAEQTRFWKLIELPVAEIWQQRPWADEGCGFWVVATFGRRCIYFNDLSQCFASSSFDRWGNIIEFDPTSQTLQSLLSSLLPQTETA